MGWMAGRQDGSLEARRSAENYRFSHPGKALARNLESRLPKGAQAGHILVVWMIPPPPKAREPPAFPERPHPRLRVRGTRGLGLDMRHGEQVPCTTAGPA